MTAPWLVVSPHCDDAVFACGELLARHPGSVVATVFAGSPLRYEPFTEWDHACGFKPGDDVMAMRRAEDERALERLAASPVWLSFLDSQYRAAPRLDAIAAALRETIRNCAPRAIAFPLGLFHSDHVLVREAMLVLLASQELPTAVMYVDVLYRRIAGLADQQKAQLARRGYALRPRRAGSTPRARASKREAIACYASQLRALATPGRLGHQDAFAAEVYLEIDAMEVASS